MQVSQRNIDITISAPPSKSETLRAMLFAFLYEGQTIITNFSKCDDAVAMLNILKNYKNIRISDSVLTIEGGTLGKNCTFQCSESGFLARAFAAIPPFIFDSAEILASGSLQKRNLSDIYEFCKNNDLIFEGQFPHLPLKISSRYNKDRIIVNSASSSQILSGALIGNALAPNPLLIETDNPSSKGYIDLTLEMLEKVGIKYKHYANTYELIERKIFDTPHFVIEGDWSAAAFMLVAGAIAGRTEINGLDISSKQPDKIIVDLLKEVGVKVSESFDNGKYLIISEKSEINAFEFDATNYPDLIPPLVALALNANGESVIYGAGRLINKESNRKTALVEEFKKIGAEIASSENSLIIRKSEIKGGNVFSHKDHRIAMALAVAGLNSNSPVNISNSQSVTKSYPSFFEDLLK